MRGNRGTVVAMFLLALAAPAPGALRRQGRGTSMHRSSNVSLRKRLNVNDLIAEPGTVELDWGSLYSYTTGAWTAPSTVKFTPEGGSLLWGRTEYSAAFDSVESVVNTGTRSTHFGERLTVAATAVVFDSPYFDIAIAPQATALLRNERGVRLGGTAIARFDRARNSIGLTASWSGATAASESNPAGVWDFGGGWGRPLAAAGLLGKITPHANAVWERATGYRRTVGLFAGVEYQAHKRVSVDISAQRLGLAGIGPDRQLLVGLTVNLGK